VDGFGERLELADHPAARSWRVWPGQLPGHVRTLAVPETAVPDVTELLGDLRPRVLQPRADLDFHGRGVFVDDHVDGPAAVAVPPLLPAVDFEGRPGAVTERLHDAADDPVLVQAATVGDDAGSREILDLPQGVVRPAELVGDGPCRLEGAGCVLQAHVPEAPGDLVGYLLIELRQPGQQLVVGVAYGAWLGEAFSQQAELVAGERARLRRNRSAPSPTAQARA
jgi:hypothetical protein